MFHISVGNYEKARTNTFLKLLIINNYNVPTFFQEKASEVGKNHDIVKDISYATEASLAGVEDLNDVLQDVYGSAKDNQNLIHNEYDSSKAGQSQEKHAYSIAQTKLRQDDNRRTAPDSLYTFNPRAEYVSVETEDEQHPSLQTEDQFQSIDYDGPSFLNVGFNAPENKNINVFAENLQNIFMEDENLPPLPTFENTQINHSENEAMLTQVDREREYDGIESFFDTLQNQGSHYSPPILDQETNYDIHQDFKEEHTDRNQLILLKKVKNQVDHRNENGQTVENKQNENQELMHLNASIEENYNGGSLIDLYRTEDVKIIDHRKLHDHNQTDIHNMSLNSLAENSLMNSEHKDHDKASDYDNSFQEDSNTLRNSHFNLTQGEISKLFTG